MCVHASRWDFNGAMVLKSHWDTGNLGKSHLADGYTEARSVTGSHLSTQERGTTCSLSSPWKKLWEVSGL